MRWPAALALFGAAAAAQPLPIVGLSHVGVRVTSLDAALRFYTGLLGIPVAFRTLRPDGSVAIAVLQVNDNQYVELIPGLPPGQLLRITHVSLETTDAARLRLLLNRRGLTPGDLREGRDGNLSFRLPDGEGNTLEFTEYRPTSNHTITRGQNAPLPRISNRLLHAAIFVERRHLNRFLDSYRTKLGFEVAHYGSAVNGRSQCVNLKMPGARGDLLEAAILDAPLGPGAIVAHQHISFEVPDAAAAYEELRRRGLPAGPRTSPRSDSRGRRFLNLFDPDGARIELLPLNPPAPASGAASDALPPSRPKQPGTLRGLPLSQTR